MALFYVDNYPDWLDELMNKIYELYEDINDSDFDEKVWTLVKGADEIPNIGNQQVYVLFKDVKRILARKYKDELYEACISTERFEACFNYEANSMASYFYFDNESFTELEEVDSMIKEWIKENSNEQE